MSKVCDSNTLNPHDGQLQRIRPDSFAYTTIEAGHTHKVHEFTEMFLSGGLDLIGDIIIEGTLTLGCSQGNVVGPPGGATDNAVARYDTTTGELLQDSQVTIDDSGNMTMGSGQINTVAGTTSTVAIHFAEATALKTTPVAGDMEYKGGHFYLTNGARHVLVTSAGVKTSTTTITNTTTETEIYNYVFAAGELHADERIEFTMDGVVSTASGSDDYVIRFKVAGATLHTLSRAGGNVSDVGWEAVYKGTIRTAGASGTFVDFAKFIEDDLSYAAGDATTHSIDTTATVTFSVTVQWTNAKAGNVFTCTQADLTFKH